MCVPCWGFTSWTSYHPQCSGMVERFNRKLTGMLRSQSTKHGAQWDGYLSGLLWAYRNTPHESTGEKPSFLMYGLDCRSPTEATFLPLNEVQPIDLIDYREKLMMSLTNARSLATAHIRRAQRSTRTNTTKGSTLPNAESEIWSWFASPMRRVEQTGSSPSLGMVHTECFHLMDPILQLRKGTSHRKKPSCSPQQGSAFTCLLPCGLLVLLSQSASLNITQDELMPCAKMKAKCRVAERPQRQKSVTAQVELLEGGGDVKQWHNSVVLLCISVNRQLLIGLVWSLRVCLCVIVLLTYIGSSTKRWNCTDCGSLA